jgi:hypothetical protein
MENSTQPSESVANRERLFTLCLLSSSLCSCCVGGIAGMGVGLWIGRTFGNINTWDDIAGGSWGICAGGLIGFFLPSAVALTYVVFWNRRSRSGELRGNGDGASERNPSLPT